MSEVAEELVGDAGDDAFGFDGHEDVPSISHVKTQLSSNMEKQGTDQCSKSLSGSVEQRNTQIISKPSLKAKTGKIRSSLKVQPGQDDLLQALCGDVSSFPTSKVNKGVTGVKQKVNKMPAKDGSPLNVKSSKQNDAENVPTRSPQMDKSISDSEIKESPTDTDSKTVEEMPSSDKKCAPNVHIKSSEVKMSPPRVQKVATPKNSGPSLLEIMSAGNTLNREEKKDSRKTVREKSDKKEKHSATLTQTSKPTVNPTKNIKSEPKNAPKREDNLRKPDSGAGAGNLSARYQKQETEIISGEKNPAEEKGNKKGSSETEKTAVVEEKSSVLSGKSKSSDGVKSSQRVNCKAEDDAEMSSFTEEDLKNIDQYLVDQMVDGFIKHAFPSHNSTDTRIKVKVSPLEIADLAEPSVQNLINECPKISLIFRRQIGKFKKKKGYAEINFTSTLEVKDFIKKLIPLKLVEKKIEINISACISGVSQELSFCLSLRDSRKLMTLINSGQDPQNIIISTKHPKLQFELVPSTMTVPILQSLFPFSSFVRICKDVQDRISGKSLTGPVLVQYNNPKYQDAVMECFSNFTADGHCLKLLGDNKTLNSSGTQDKEPSVRERQKEKINTGTPSTKAKEDKETSQQSERTKSEEREVCKDDGDDDISNMTRDVCAGMLESLDKLKQLDANNPNIERILKMRDQLDKLQKSLGQPQRVKHSPETKNKDVHGRNQEDPWEVGLQDVDDKSGSSNKDSVKHDGSHISISRSGSKSKRGQKYSRSTSSEQEVSLLHVFEKTNESRNDESRNMPRKKRDSLSERDSGFSEKSSKQKAREEEEELQRHNEAAQKEAERIQLIQKIEEARLRDLKKAEERAQSRTIWNSDRERRRESPFSHKSSVPETHPSSSSAGGSRDKGFDRGNNSRSNKRSFEETKTTHDDGVDQRLAAFERELAEKGVIQSHPSPSKRPKSMGSDSFMSSESSPGVPILMEDEYQSLLEEGRHVLPPDFRVRIQSSLNRHCPVKSCPDTKLFRDISSFLEHWSIFHVPETTMRFCQKCVAYFMSPEELEMHLKKAHRISANEAQYMVCQARVKVISNPSFRDPHPYLPP